MSTHLSDDNPLRGPLPAAPGALVEQWLADAVALGAAAGVDADDTLRNPLAVALATVDTAGRPHLRMLLCRGFEPEVVAFTFFTNRNSPKGRQLAERPWGALTFHWDALHRQLRVEGPVAASADTDSDRYWSRRHRASQVSAWASEQSAPIASREAFEAGRAAMEERFGGAGGPPIPRPSHWGGYRLLADRVELWVGSEGRAHDRACWTRELPEGAAGNAGFADDASAWVVRRLQP